MKNSRADPPESIELEERARGSSRDELIEALGALMNERDEVEVPLLDVARRAGLNVALVKYYFGGKDGLLLALASRDLEQARIQLEALVQSERPPEEKMRVHIAGMISLYFKRPYINRLVIQIAQYGSAEDRSYILDNFIRPMFEAYDKLLEAGMATQVFRPVEPMLFYFNIIGACDQIISARIVLREIYGIEELDDDLRRRYQRQTVETLMAGILQTKAS